MTAASFVVGLVWTFDHITELVGAILAGLAAVGGVAAAIYSRSGNRNATANWSAQIRPGITFVAPPREREQHHALVRINNSGGPFDLASLRSAIATEFVLAAIRCQNTRSTMRFDCRW